MCLATGVQARIQGETMKEKEFLKNEIDKLENTLAKIQESYETILSMQEDYIAASSDYIKELHRIIENNLDELKDIL